MGHTVRSHTRRTASGRTTTVHQHSKAGRPTRVKSRRRPRRGGPFAVGMGLLSAPSRRPQPKPRRRRKSLARRSWKNVKRSWKAASRRKKWAAAGFAGLATVQIGAFVGLQGVAFTATTIGVAAIVTGSVARFLAGSKGRRS